MRCPDCGNKLEVFQLKGINIHECLNCKGKWFERNELMRAKDRVDDSLRWLDFDPFGQDAKELSVASGGKECPQCSKQMQSLTYLHSKVIIDKCQSCKGAWLTHGELAKIIRYLKKVIDSKSAKDLTKDSFKKFIEIFTGHKGLISEVKDFLAVLYILDLRVAIEHPTLVRIAENIYKYTPFK